MKRRKNSIKQNRILLMGCILALSTAVLAAGCGSKGGNADSGTEETVVSDSGSGGASDDSDAGTTEQISADSILDKSSETTEETVPFDPASDSFLSKGSAIAAEGQTAEENTNNSLAVPTILKRIGDDWFLADCYNSRILYTTGEADTVFAAPVGEWHQLPGMGMKQPHTIAGDGTVLLADDTENNRVLVYTRGENGEYLCTQSFDEIGDRPHYSVYDSNTDTFYVWSSESGELFLFRRAAGTTEVYETEVRTCTRLKNTYVRSFTILGGCILFVSGTSSAGDVPSLVLCDLEDLTVRAEYPVSAAFAGMVAIIPVLETEENGTESNTAGENSALHTQENFPGGSPNGYFVTISTDITGDQSYATMLYTSSLEALTDTADASGVTDIYSTFFVGGGTPYYMTRIDGRYYLTEHRLPDHYLWSFAVTDGKITDVKALY